MEKERKIELKKILKVFVIVYLLGYILMLVYFYQNQRAIIFKPEARTVEEINDFAKESGYFLMTNVTEDALELTYLLKEPKKNKPIIIFFNGNAAKIERAHETLEPFFKQGYGAVINIYRGYGANPGSPTEKDFFSDSQNLYDLVNYSYPSNKIILWGYSLGSAVAIHLAANNEARALVIESGLSSVLDIAKSRYPFLPIGWLLEDKFLSINYIKGVSEPALMIHGKKDKVVDLKSAEKLSKNKNIKLLIYENGDHSNLKELDAYKDVLKWLKKL
ncbi:MAG TPA: hypothetical protein DCL21_01445 [Alphaproteobacteria bacterium]|nr:hypothetical protein [Alphaproteobacteria bacterium]